MINVLHKKVPFSFDLKPHFISEVLMMKHHCTNILVSVLRSYFTWKLYRKLMLLYSFYTNIYIADYISIFWWLRSKLVHCTVHCLILLGPFPHLKDTVLWIYTYLSVLATTIISCIVLLFWVTTCCRRQRDLQLSRLNTVQAQV